VLFLALLALSEQWPARLPTFSGQAWAAIVFIGVSSAIGYFGGSTRSSRSRRRG
jgi:hypothetical protein